MRFKRITTALLVSYLAAIAIVGFWPERVDTAFRGDVVRVVETMSNNGFVYMSYDLVDAFANVMWFVPIGVLALLTIGRRYWVVALLLCVAISCVVEVAQASVLSSRVGSISDVVANSVGAVTGILVGVIIDQYRSLRQRHRTSQFNAAPALERDALQLRSIAELV